jgi:hypothetical protein
MSAAWREFLSTWEQFEAEAQAFREIDGQRVLVLAHNTGRGKLSGVEVRSISMREANVFDIREDKVVRLVNYWDRERALADLGLSE